MSSAKRICEAVIRAISEPGSKLTAPMAAFVAAHWAISDAMHVSRQNGNDAANETPLSVAEQSQAARRSSNASDEVPARMVMYAATSVGTCICGASTADSTIIAVGIFCDANSAHFSPTCRLPPERKSTTSEAFMQEVCAFAVSMSNTLTEALVRAGTRACRSACTRYEGHVRSTKTLTDTASSWSKSPPRPCTKELTIFAVDVLRAMTPPL